MCMHRTQILIPDDQWQAIRAFALKQGKSIGQVIREQISLITSKSLRYDPAGLSKMCGFVKDTCDASTQIDDSLYGAPKRHKRK